jgi:uncharacterized protein YdaU (DUF1376 family)
MHYYQFNVGDYRRDTSHLSLTEHGIYRMLLDTYYLNDGPIDADDAKLMRTHCVRTADEVQAYKNVINDYFELRDGQYFHRGCDKVLGQIFEKSDKARQSAMARWNKKSNKNKAETRHECDNDANALRTHSESSANGMLPNNPITHNPISKKPSSSNKFTEADLSFAEFMFDRILMAAPKAKPPNLETWANEIRLMRDVDNLSPEEIRQVFEFANTDPFWRLNILSPSTLRKQFPKLHAKMTGGSHENYQRAAAKETRSERIAREEREWLRSIGVS